MSDKKIIIEINEEVGSILIYDELDPYKGIDILDITEFEKALDIVREHANVEEPMEH